jgi:hypothetical protein
MRTSAAYRFSRIQAEGWNAARRFPSEDLADLDAATIGTLSPYHNDPEKARWIVGFRSAFKAPSAVTA